MNKPTKTNLERFDVMTDDMIDTSEIPSLGDAFFAGAKWRMPTSGIFKGVHPMTKVEATAEVFWTAFNVLPVAEKRAVIQHIIEDEDLRHDLMDLSVMEERRNESARPLRDYLKEKGKQG